jgi:putative peptidoglycan lipid II flippase
MNRSNENFNTRAAGVVAGAVMLSRLLGLCRELVFAGLFGAGRGMDAFITAFRAPNLLRDLFAEGALSTAFVTVFSQKIATEGEDSAWNLAAKMGSLTTVFMSLISLLGVVFAPQLISLLAPGFSPDKIVLTVLLTRIMYPFILLVSLAALAMGMLNAKNIFTAPALASSFFNLGSILGGVVFGWWLDPHFGERALMGLALGTLLGGLLQLLVQMPSLYRAGFHWILDCHWRDPGVKKVLLLMLPAVIAASAVQINVMVNSIFASYLGDGPVSWLSFSFRLMQLPLGVFGVAIATVTLPVVSRMAILGDMVQFCATLGRAMRLALFLTLPSALGLMVLAEPIIALIYQRGKFLPSDTLHTAEALQCYALGLIAYACIKVLTPAFYSINRRWTPMMISFLSIGFNLLFNTLFIFHFKMGHQGLALSTSLAAVLNVTMLTLFMMRFVGTLHLRKLWSTLWRSVIASIPMIALAIAADPWLHHLSNMSLPLRVTGLLGVITVAVALFITMGWLLKIEELSGVFLLLKKKLKI